MRNIRGRRITVMLLCALFVSVAWAQVTEQAIKQKQPSTWELIQKARQKQPDSNPSEFSKVMELLEKYAVTQDKLRTSFISKSENRLEAEASIKNRPQWKKGVKYNFYHKLELRSDGNRYYSLFKKWGDSTIKETSTEEHASNTLALWDGESRFQYTCVDINNAGTLILKRKDNVNMAILPRTVNSTLGKPIRGFFDGSSGRIDAELRQANRISVRPEKENIKGSNCYVIEAKTPRSEFTIWIDPEHDYNMAQANIKRKSVTAGDPKEYSNPPKGTSQLDLKNVRFKKIDDVWLPVECDYSVNKLYDNGDYLFSNYHHKITEFIRNPDHEALNSFESNFIKNGSKVYLIGVEGITYRWQDGKVLDANGKIILDCSKRTSEGENNNAKD